MTQFAYELNRLLRLTDVDLGTVAEEFGASKTTVLRWSLGQACPHDLIQPVVLGFLNDRVKNIRVMYLHGLHGGPNSDKAVYLRGLYRNVSTPELETEYLADVLERGLSIDPEQALRPSINIATREILSFQPDVIVGSSFGGAVLAQMIHESLWVGPSVLLAPAWKKITGQCSLAPDKAKNLIVFHSQEDDVVPFEDSIELVNNVGFVIPIDGGHRLFSLTDPDSRTRLEDCIGVNLCSKNLKLKEDL